MKKLHYWVGVYEYEGENYRAIIGAKNFEEAYKLYSCGNKVTDRPHIKKSDCISIPDAEPGVWLRNVYTHTWDKIK